MQTDEKQKADLYKNIKLTGLILFIPFVLPSGPIAGYYCADFLVKKYGLPNYLYAVLVAIGLLASLLETIRIIKLAVKTTKT